MKEPLSKVVVVGLTLLIVACTKNTPTPATQTPSPPPSNIVATDKDGYTYKTVTIGTQTWMAENLKTLHYNNGDLIDTSNPISQDVSAEKEPKYQWARDSLLATYGRLYTWYVVMDARGVCPSGWHIPSDAEWATLIKYLGTVPGSKMKETGTKHWLNYTYNGSDNSSGFTALPGGYRNDIEPSYSIGTKAVWWSSTENNVVSAWNRYLMDQFDAVYSIPYNKKAGLSVRCIKD
jgi:uncharacterized protein (TIGR02145 family)